MNKVILADNQAIFRAGTAKILAMEDDFRIIAQCPDVERLYQAIDSFRGAILMIASTLKTDLQLLMDRAGRAGSRVVAILENEESPKSFLAWGIQGLIFRDVSGPAMIDCVRRVAAGEQYLQPATNIQQPIIEDLVGARVRDRLTPKEMKIVALIVQGCKNKEIAIRLGTTEQVVKNYLRSIYDKTGVSDRLELALFTIHHKMLAEAAEAVGNQMMQVY
ncbi:MAG TPA: response regulator transcription factor [Pseudacidobacterium sp.]|jgi:DNA-binding NarL/FixJ family response regulator|nr:response regulator transcription factor [Pseudacidobacterium sp.]